MAQFGEYTVDLLEEREIKRYIIRKITVYNIKVCALFMTQCFLQFCLQQTSDVHEVVQLHMLNWSPDGSCSNLNTITSVIREMIDIQMKTGNHSIVVHCRCK